MTLLKQSTVRTVLIGPVLDSDGAAKTDEVIASIKITKNGTVGAADGSATLTHDHAGKYKLALTANDVDTLGVLEISLNSGTNDMAIRSFNVVPANVFDAIISGSDNLDVATVEWNGVALGTTNPLPNAAADAAGGLPISDAGGLDLDTVLGYLTGAVALATELAKVPKSDSDITWNSTALASINAEADTALTDAGVAKAAVLGAAVGASISADIAAVKSDTGTVLTRIPAALFSGITSLAQWLGVFAGKQAGNATAQTEIRATGEGGGTYDPTQDSLEAIRDRGDSAWGTATSVTVTSVADGAIGADAVADIFSTTTIAEAYPTDGSAGTPAQCLYLIMQSLHEFSISSTTRTVKKLDGTTTAATFTLDDDTSPTSTTRAT